MTFVTSHLILFQGGTKLERARDLFEQCLENCPHKFAKGIYICIYSKPCLKPTTLEHTILVILDRWKISNIRTTFVLVYYNGFYFIYYEKNVLNSDGHQFHQYQQIDQPPLILAWLTEHKKTRNIWRCKSRSWLGTGTKMLLGYTDKFHCYWSYHF